MDMYTILGKLQSAFPEANIELKSTGSMHKGHGSCGLHLKTEIIWKGFENKSLVEKHQLVHAVLKNELGNEIHALSISTKEN